MSSRNQGLDLPWVLLCHDSVYVCLLKRVGKLVLNFSFTKQAFLFSGILLLSACLVVSLPFSFYQYNEDSHPPHAVKHTDIPLKIH